LCCGSENLIINKGDTQKLEAEQMRFLRPLFGFTRLDHQRNHDIHSTLKLDIIVEDKIVSEELIRSSEMNGQNLLTKAGFPVPRDGEIWEDLDKDGETKNL
jgi:hypothetical protein